MIKREKVSTSKNVINELYFERNKEMIIKNQLPETEI
jgi:hypothetical protein